jgi:hypothetical protein
LIIFKPTKQVSKKQTDKKKTRIAYQRKGRKQYYKNNPYGCSKIEIREKSELPDEVGL